MLVVADSSPLIVLIKIGYIEILPQLFGTVLIPPSISAELKNEKRPQSVHSFIEKPPAWLIEQAPIAIDEIPLLDPGEIAAINLALEIRADILLIDESMGRKAAVARGIPIAGTIGVLEQAADQNLVDLRDVFGRIKETDFWISHELLDLRLRLHMERKNRTR